MDSGSYACYAVAHHDKYLNASSETILRVIPDQETKKSEFEPNLIDHEDAFGLSSDDLPDLSPILAVTDDGVCEPYRGTVCAEYLTGNYTIYSTSDAKQETIEERLKTIRSVFQSVNLTSDCAKFAMPALCFFAFPVCKRNINSPMQVCRSDCNAIQDNICRNEYFNANSLFSNKSKYFWIQ